MQYRSEINGLRALSVLLIIAYHFAMPLALVPGGFFGVDIFFVISGYLISTIIFVDLNRDHFNLLYFYGRRIRRILPSLITVLFFTLVLGYISLHPVEIRSLGHHLFGSAGLFVNFIYSSEVGYFDKSAELKPLLHLWSLSLEEQFYLLFPIFCLITVRFSISTRLIVFASVLTASLGLYLWASYSHPAAAFYLLPFRTWQLFTGGFIGLYQANYGRNNSHSLHRILVPLGFLLILVSSFYFKPQLPHPALWTLMPVLGSVLILWYAKDDFITEKIFKNKIMVFIGLISYPLYLWHYPILSFGRILQGHQPSALWSVGAVLITFILAWLTYQFIE